MKGNPGLRWGNKFGILLLPVHYHRSRGDPLEYLRKAKSMIDRKKQSLEAHFSYKIGDIIMTYLGARVWIRFTLLQFGKQIENELTNSGSVWFFWLVQVASLLNYRIVCNTTFTISNVLGPREEIAVAGNPITYIRANSSSLPHVRLPKPPHPSSFFLFPSFPRRPRTESLSGLRCDVCRRSRCTW